MCSTPEGRIGVTAPRWAGSVTRRLLLVGVAAGIVWSSAAGCQWHPQAQKEPTNFPIATDPAMQAREWPVSHAYWANGTVVAGPTRFPYTYQTQTGTGEYGPYVLDGLMFVYQSLRAPFTYLVRPPFQPNNYDAVAYEPTFDAIGKPAPESGSFRKQKPIGLPYWLYKPPAERTTVEPPPTPPPTGPQAFQGAPPTTGEATQPSGDIFNAPATTPTTQP
jgi:hypothetical protein